MLAFHNLTLGYDRHPAVHHLTATIQSGDFVALVGPNGAGKSTLMKGILGHIEPMEGDIELSGLDRDEIVYLPQSSRVDRSFPLTVFQFAISGLWQTRGLARRVKREDRHRVMDALARVGLLGFEKRAIDALSGGQFQRLLFARKLVQNGRLLLLDEPFSGVDEQTVEDLMTVLQEQHRQGATIVAVIHNINLVRSYFPTSLLLSRELIAFGDTEAVLTTEHLNRASTIGFGDHVHADICQATES